MTKLTEQEKAQLRASLDQAGRQGAASGPVGGPALTTAEYFRQLEQFARIMPRTKKPVAFEGKAWRL